MVEEASEEVRALLSGCGLRAAKIESLSPPGRGRKAGRCTFRIQTADGALVKARLLEDEAEATRLAGLRGELEVPFLPAMTRCGRLLLEPWVEGEELSQARAGVRAAELGALLGRLHGAGPRHPRDPLPTGERRERALADLELLGTARQLGESLLPGLRERLVADDPGASPAVVVHRDFCPENIVESPAGGLHVIDNEWLGIDAAGVDLGRTRARWPMSERVWREFLQGYGSSAPAPPASLDFWLIAMAARSAVVRLERPAGELAVPIARLCEMALVEGAR